MALIKDFLYWLTAELLLGKLTANSSDFSELGKHDWRGKPKLLYALEMARDYALPDGYSIS
jgi:hypothetical protein